MSERETPRHDRQELYDAVHRKVNGVAEDELRAAAFAVGRSIELARVVNVLEDLRDNDMTSGCMEACFDRAIAAIT